jgi:hypothetical protein
MIEPPAPPSPWSRLVTLLACLTWIPVVLVVVFGPYVMTALEKVFTLTLLSAVLMGTVGLRSWGWIDRAMKAPTAENAAWLLVIVLNLLVLVSLNALGDGARTFDFQQGEGLRNAIVARAQADPGPRRVVTVDGQTLSVGSVELASWGDALVARKGFVDVSGQGAGTHVLFAFEQQGEGDYLGFLYRPDDPPLTEAERASASTPAGWRLFEFGLLPKQKLAPHWYLVRFSDYL